MSIEKLEDVSVGLCPKLTVVWCDGGGETAGESERSCDDVMSRRDVCDS